MAWRRQSTTATVEAEVDLSDFSTEQLLQALIDDETITIADAESILKRKKGDMVSAPLASELDEARSDILCGRKREALINIERYLGRDFVGRLA